MAQARGPVEALYPQSPWMLLWISCTALGAAQGPRRFPGIDHFSSDFNKIAE
jgi:hypothetical protein